MTNRRINRVTRSKAKSAATARKVVDAPVEKNGWTLYAHPALLDQIDRVVDALSKNPGPQGGPAKVLSWLTRAMFDEIPQDPTRSEYRLGGALGGITHWFRDKYAARFRLFFRFDTKAKIIIYGWVNDSETLRTYGSSTDAYVVFKRMLNECNPPNDWKALLKEVSKPEAIRRLKSRQKA